MIENYNEADVRAEIIDPLIRKLGYRSGTENNIIREQQLTLRYPQSFLGRKKPNKDPLLMGSADYILEPKGTVRWVIEAKAANCPIDDDVVEQAWSYANHPEVRAVYFVVCNGHQLNLYKTQDKAGTEPIISINYPRYSDTEFEELRNILSPMALARDFPDTKIDYSPSIGEGLRSFAQITNGVIRYKSSNINNDIFEQLQTSIEMGSIERNEKGTLEARLKTRSPFQQMQNLNRKLGLDEFVASSNDTLISSNPQAPNIFYSKLKMILPKGESVLDLRTWQNVILPMNIVVIAIVQIEGYMENRRLVGTFKYEMKFSNSPTARLEGEFEIFLA